jgi:methyl-accepting chemotaxis protein
MMGRQLIDGTMPRIAKALERIADALEEANKRSSEDTAAMNKFNDSVNEIINTPMFG